MDSGSLGSKEHILRQQWAPKEPVASTSGRLLSAEPEAQNHTQASLSSWEKVGSIRPQQKPSPGGEGGSLFTTPEERACWLEETAIAPGGAD